MVDIPAHRHFSLIFPLFTLNKVWSEARPFRWDEAAGMIWTGKQITGWTPVEKRENRDMEKDRAGEIDTGFILIIFDYFPVPESIKYHA